MLSKIFSLTLLAVAGYALLWRLPELMDVLGTLQFKVNEVVALAIFFAAPAALSTKRSWMLAAWPVLAAAWLKYYMDINLAEPPRQNLRGRVALVTGGNSGVGFASACKLSQMGATVVLACRNPGKCGAAADRLRQATLAATGGELQADVHAMQVDLSSFQSVHAFADAFLERFDQLHLLVNNAGFAQAPKGALTAEGLESGLGSMHIGHFLLTNRLQDTLAATARQSPPFAVRVVNVASHGSQLTSSFNADFHPSLFEGDGEGDLRGEHLDSGSMSMYLRAKLANVLFTRELGRRWASNNVISCSMHVGAVATNVWTTDEMPAAVQMVINAWSTIFFRTSEQGARTIMQCLLGNGEDVQGKYLNGMGQVVPEEHLAAASRDDRLAARLWEVSHRIITM